MSSLIDEHTLTEVAFYAIKDVRLDVFASPFVARSDREAVAMLSYAVQPGSTLHAFPEHFELFKVGVFDDHCGRFLPFDPVLICKVLDVLVESSQIEEHDSDQEVDGDA